MFNYIKPLFLFLCILIPPQSIAKEKESYQSYAGIDAFFAGISEVEILIVGDPNECFPNPEVMKNNAEIVLLQNGINVVDGAITSIQFIISATPLNPEGGEFLGCSIVMRGVVVDLVLVIFTEISFEQTLTDFEYTFYTNNIVGSDKERVKEGIEVEVENATKNLVLKILRAKERINTQFPEALHNLKK